LKKKEDPLPKVESGKITKLVQKDSPKSGKLGATFQKIILQLQSSVPHGTISKSEEAKPNFDSFRYVLKAATSAATKLHQPSVTYLNKGQMYELEIKNLGDSQKVVKCQLRIGFQERHLIYRERDMFQEWSRKNAQEKVLEIDSQISYGIIDLGSHPDFQNVVSFRWDTSKEATVCFRVNCIGSEFTSRRNGGEKGVSFQLQVSKFHFDVNVKKIIGSILHLVC
jgi:hypothetical protein